MAHAHKPGGLDPLLQEAERRGYLSVEGDRITYHCKTDRTYCFSDPEELARAITYSWLIIERRYLPQQVDLEVKVPRRTPDVWADIVVYEDTACRRPYLIVENVKRAAAAADVVQRIERGGGNTPDGKSRSDDFGDSVSNLEFEPGLGIFVTASPIHGRGVFASVPFAPGDLVECCPLVILPPDVARAVAETDLGRKCFGWGSEVRALALGYGSLYNHARLPNAQFILSLKAHTISFVAIRPIARDDEITINYSGYPDGSREHRLDAPSCGGREPEAWDEA